MESHSESTNSGARSDEVADSLRARIAGNIRYERQMQLTRISHQGVGKGLPGVA